MRRYDDLLYPEDWKIVAHKDIERVNRNLRDDDVEAAGFFLQQSLEKHIKAFLLEKGWQLQKTHNLSALLDYAVEYNPRLETFRTLCERVANYYIMLRYPMFDVPELAREDVERDLKEAKIFINAFDL